MEITLLGALSKKDFGIWVHLLAYAAMHRAFLASTKNKMEKTGSLTKGYVKVKRFLLVECNSLAARPKLLVYKYLLGY